MKIRFNPCRLLFPSDSPAADASPAGNASEGASNEQADHSTSTPTSPPVNNASQLSSLSPQVDATSGPTSSPAVVEGLTLSTMIIPKVHQSLQLSRICATIAEGKNVTHVAAISDGPRVVRVVFGNGSGELFFIKPITIESDDANSNDSNSPHSLVPFQGPESEVSSLVLSSDNTKLLVTWASGKVMAFDARDGRKLNECDAPKDLINDCAFSKDGKRVVIGGNHGWKMFDFNNFPDKVESDEMTSTREGGGVVISVNFSDDDTKLAVGVLYDGDVEGCYIYNIKGTKLLRTFCKGEKVFKVTFSPNNMFLAIGCERKVYLFNIATGDCLRTFVIMGECRDIQFSKEGRRIFFGTHGSKSTAKGNFFHRDSMVYGCDVYSETIEFEIKFSQTVLSIALLNNKTLVAACSHYGHCKVINIAANPLHQVKHGMQILEDSRVSPPDGTLMAFRYIGGFKVYDTSNNQLVSENDSEGYPEAFCFSPCGKTIASNVSSCNDIIFYNVENIVATKERTINTPQYLNWIEFLEDGKHILGFRKGTTIAYVINIGSEENETADDQLTITTSKHIMYACINPQKNLFAIATEEAISFHSVSDGQINNTFTYTLNKEQDGLIHAMKFTQDGSRMVLAFETHGNTFNLFHHDVHDVHGVDPSSKVLSTVLQLQQGGTIRGIQISTDNKVLAIYDTSNHIYICSLEEGVNEKDVYKCPAMHTEIVSISFLPRLSDEGHYQLVVSYRYIEDERESFATTTLEVSVNQGVIDPLLLFRYLDFCKDEAMLAMIAKHKDLLHRRDENGMTLAECALDPKRPAILRKIIHLDPLLAWTSHKVLNYFLNTTDENMIELIMSYKCILPIDPAILEVLVEHIPTLAKNGSTRLICCMLEAGASKCSNGFAPGNKKSLKAFLNFDLFGSLFLDKSKPCDGSRIIPEASSSPSDLEMYNKDDDDEPRIKLNIARANLPNLSRSKQLTALVDMYLSSGEEGEGSSVIPQHLKPFQCQSLQSSIEAAWYSWAGPMFLRRALLYLFWMVCIICLEYTTNMTWLRVSVIIAICMGWLCFARFEVHQCTDKNYWFQYFSNFWNLWQTLSLLLVLIYVCLNIVDMVISDSTRTPILSQHEWFPGMVHLFTLINILYYLRGIQKASWILYALGVLIQKMSYFLFILLWILISACSQLAKVKGAFDTKEPIHIFIETYVTAIFGALESSEFCSDPYIEASTVVLVLFFLLSWIFMIFMNAMIAFISEEFANILDYQKAILAREMACLIVDLYSSMTEKERIIIEENCKWVYKLFKQADLNMMGSGDTESDGDGRRATKKDVQSASAKLRKEMKSCSQRMESEMKLSIEEIKKENCEMKSSIEEIKKENGELKSSLERMEIENKVALEKIIALLS